MLKIKIISIIVLLAIILSACGAVTPYPTPTMPSPTLILPTTTPLPTLTGTPTITSTFENTPTPETVFGYPTPEAAEVPTCVPMMDCLKLTPNIQRQDISFNELYIGKYVLRSWCNVDSRYDFCPYSAITISSRDGQHIEIGGYPVWLGKETGADLTGDGTPDIVINWWSGGGMCCQKILLYEAGDKLKKIMDIGPDHVGTFTDLNGDGTYEYVAPEDISSSFCYNCGAFTSVVYEYQPKLGYIPATDKFKDVLSADIKEGLNFINQFTEQNPNMLFYFPDINLYDNPSADDKAYLKYWSENADYSRAVNSVYELVVNYLLAGQQSNGQKILNKYFPSDKASEYLLGIKNDLQGLLAP